MLRLIRQQLTTQIKQYIALKLNSIQIHNATVARFFCRLIPASCPFERDIRCFGRLLVHIPPMCKLNPFYEQLMELRFKALCYLADVCGEDIASYC